MGELSYGSSAQKRITFITPHHANNHITQHMNHNSLFKWLYFIVSIIPVIFSSGLKITDAHFASVNERIQPGLESTHPIML